MYTSAGDHLTLSCVVTLPCDCVYRVIVVVRRTLLANTLFPAAWVAAFDSVSLKVINTEVDSEPEQSYKTLKQSYHSRATVT